MSFIVPEQFTRYVEECNTILGELTKKIPKIDNELILKAIKMFEIIDEYEKITSNNFNIAFENHNNSSDSDKQIISVSLNYISDLMSHIDEYKRENEFYNCLKLFVNHHKKGDLEQYKSDIFVQVSTILIEIQYKYVKNCSDKDDKFVSEYSTFKNLYDKVFNYRILKNPSLAIALDESFAKAAYDENIVTKLLRINYKYRKSINYKEIFKAYVEKAIKSIESKKYDYLLDTKLTIIYNIISLFMVHHEGTVHELIVLPGVEMIKKFCIEYTKDSTENNVMRKLLTVIETFDDAGIANASNANVAAVSSNYNPQITEGIKRKLETDLFLLNDMATNYHKLKKSDQDQLFKTVIDIGVIKFSESMRYVEHNSTEILQTLTDLNIRTNTPKVLDMLRQIEIKGRSDKNQQILYKLLKHVVTDIVTLVNKFLYIQFAELFALISADIKKLSATNNATEKKLITERLYSHQNTIIEMYNDTIVTMQKNKYSFDHIYTMMFVLNEFYRIKKATQGVGNFDIDSTTKKSTAPTMSKKELLVFESRFETLRDLLFENLDTFITIPEKLLPFTSFKQVRVKIQLRETNHIDIVFTQELFSVKYTVEEFTIEKLANVITNFNCKHDFLLSLIDSGFRFIEDGVENSEYKIRLIHDTIQITSSNRTVRHFGSYEQARLYIM